jgi:hypothetical protein
MSLLSRLLRSKERQPPSYRNDAVIRRIMEEQGVDRDTATAWFDEMLVFLELCAESKELLSPPKQIDAAWHAFILHTRDYEAYCRERFGRVIHHQPTEGADPTAYQRAYERRQSWSQGGADPALWAMPIASDSGSSSGDFGSSGDSGDSGGSSCGGSSCGSSCGGGAS